MASSAGNLSIRDDIGDEAAGVAADGVGDFAERSQFERIRDFLADHIGAVRRIEEGQHSAVTLVELAEDELGALKREFEAARLPGKIAG